MRILSRRSLPVLVVPLLLTALAVSGFAAAPAGAQESTPAAGPSPSAPAAVEVTTADSGRTVTLVTGQHLRVRLVAPEGEQWQGPANTPSPTTDGLYLVEYREDERETTARLHALRTGTFELRARTDRRCFHTGEPCPQAFSEWSLRVVVEPGPAPDTAYDCMPEPMPTASPDTVYLGRSDHGRRVTVPLGHRVQVYLGGCATQEDPFALVTADRPNAPLFRDFAALRVRGGNSTTLSAVATGTATIRAFTDPPCFHVAQPCARPSFLWSVEVEVVPAITDDRCATPPVLHLDPETVVATRAAVASVEATPGDVIDLYAYTRPSTTYRLVRSQAAGADGVARFALRPPANTRLYAQKRGCAGNGPPRVLNVATALTLTVERSGPREYVFTGDSLPARSGGLIVSLYRVTGDGRQVLTAQTRADSATGEWRLVRRFTGTGRFGFVVRTGQDLQNAPGVSNVRSLLVF